MSEGFEYRVGRRLAWLAGAAAICVASAAQAETTHTVAIEAGQLEPALISLAAQTKQQIMFSKGTVAGRRAPAVKGRLSVDAALDRLLSGA